MYYASFLAARQRKDFLMPQVKLFTSESVCAGHPDKIADAVSDAILDAILTQDPHARTGIETVSGANQVSLFGEIKTTDRKSVV